MEKIGCNVIRDLLPLYCDEICSQESNLLIENHLRDCPECRALLEKMKTECHVAQELEQEHEDAFKNMASSWKKSIFKSFLKGVLLTLCACLVLFGAYWGMSRWILVSVPYESIQEVIVNETDTHVEISLQTTDGKKVRSSSTEFAEDGTYYITLKRGFLSLNHGKVDNYNGTKHIPKKARKESGEIIEITQICYGTPENNVILWEAE